MHSALDEPMIAELERQLRRFRAGLLSQRQHPTKGQICLDGFARLLPLLGGYAGMLLLPHPLDIAATIVFAIATISALGSWFHDGVHDAIRHPFATILKRAAAAPVGFSLLWWQLKHLRLHHRYPGNPKFDPDIQFTYVARVTPEQRWRPWHATQHLHMWLLYPLATLNTLRPVDVLQSRRYAQLLGLRSTTPAWLLLVDKYGPYLLVWTPLPLTHSGWDAVQVFLAFHLTTGVFTSLITQIQHNTALTLLPGVALSKFPLCEQVLRTADVGGSRGVWWWLCGGVNFHAAHHLAPSLSFFETPKATARLLMLLRENGIDLPVHSGLCAAIHSHATLLRRLSKPATPLPQEAT